MSPFRLFAITAFIMLDILAGRASGKMTDIQGTVRDSTDNSVLAGAIAELVDSSGTTLRYTTTSTDGNFIFENEKSSGMSLRVSMMGYVTRTISPIPPDGNVGILLLSPEMLFIESAVLNEQAIRSSQNGDTLSYNAAAYKVMMGADSESLIAKMPGISVSDNGVEANGRDVRKILIDGQEFFGDNVLTALKNIPADMIKQIEVINKLSDSAEMTGVDDGEGYTAINIVTKPESRSGAATGRLYAGYGLPDKYIAGGNVNYFGKDRSASLLGMGNNISKYNFSSSDLVGASSSNESAAGQEFKVKPLPGLSSVQSTGANYTNKWFTGSYFFNRIRNNNTSSVNKETMVDDDKLQLTRTGSDFNALNYNHRFSAKITLSPSPKHSFIIRPSVDFQDMADGREQESGIWNIVSGDRRFIRNRLNISDNDRWALRAGGSVSYRYKFDKKGRYLSVSGTGRYYRNCSDEHTSQFNFKDEDTDFNTEAAASGSAQNRDKSTEQTSINASVIFTEPISRKSRMSLEYRMSSVNSTGDNRVYLRDNKTGTFSETPDKRQSSINTSLFFTNSIGARYSYAFRKITVTASAAYQNVRFRGSAELPYEDLSKRTFHNPVYNIIANIPFNQDNTLRIEARGKTANPSVNMLQNVVNLNNTSNIRAGNPEISPSYIHDVKFRYIHTDKKAGSTLSVSLNYLGSPNYMCDSLVINTPDFVVTDGVLLGEGNQFVKPINLGGYNKLTGKVTYGFPIKPLRCNFNLNSTVSVSTLPGMVNGDRVPVLRNWYDLGARLDSNISENIDFTISYNGRFTQNEYSGRFGKTRNNFITQNARGLIKWVFWKGISFTGSILYRQNRNTDGRYDDNILLCDAYIGKRLFRNQLGEISIGINDIFNNNVRQFGHSISASGTTDTINEGIGRYWSIQFVYHLRAMRKS